MTHTSSDTRPTLLARLIDPHPDPGSWDEFVRCYGGQIVAWCRAWGLQPSDADDVAQTVLIRLLRKMQRFQYDPTRSFRGWLRTVSFRVFQDWRADTTEPTGSGDSGIHRLLASAEAQDDLAARIEAEYAREVLNVAMFRVRRRVQANTWAAFYQTAVEGRSPADVASELKVSVAHLFVYRTRVRRMLQDELSLLDHNPAARPESDA